MTAPEMKYLHARRKELGGYLPARQHTDRPLEIPRLCLCSSRCSRAVVTVKCPRRWPMCALLTLCAVTRISASTSCRSCRTRRAPSAWRGCSASWASIHRWASYTRRQDKGEIMFYKEDKSGQILEEGINEAGAMSLLDRRGDLLQSPRRQHDPVLHLLLDVRFPAYRRSGVGCGRYAARAVF